MTGSEEGAGSPLGISDKASAAAQKTTFASRARGPKKPASQARNQAAPANMPDTSCAAPKNTVAVGKAKTKKWAPHPRRADHVPSSTSESKTRTLAHTARQDPAHLSSEAARWKHKYEELLMEVEEVKNEKETAKRNHDKHIAELNEILAANQSCREQADTECADMAEQLVDARANLELCSQRNRDLEYDHEVLSTQFSSACSLIKNLEPQAELAGELQTELNSLRNVRVPSLEQENRLLKQELRKILEDPETPSGALELAASRIQAQQCSDNSNAEALRILLRKDQAYIDQLENTCKWLETGYANAIFEVDDLENHIATLQTATGHFKEQHEDLVFGSNQLMQDPEELQPEERVLRVVNTGTRTTSTGSTASVPSTLSGVAAAVQTFARKPLSMSSGSLTDTEVTGVAAAIPMFARKPLSMSSGNLTDTEVDLCPAPKIRMAAISAIVIQPVDPAPVRKPQAPLERDLQITIQIEPTDHSKLSLIEWLTSVTTTGTSFRINGPTESVKALARRMVDSQARAMENEAKLLELQKVTWSNIAEIKRMKNAACNLAEHKALGDELVAMEARLSMQDMLLADYGRQLAQFKKNAAN
jgi:hypothetical protein